MDYLRIYDKLVDRARTRQPPLTYTELHHVIPRSHGGSDDPSNLVILTLKEHRLAHLLLAVAGHTEQWWSVKAILDDRLNKNRPQRFRHKDLIVTRFIRQILAKIASQHRRQHPMLLTQNHTIRKFK